MSNQPFNLPINLNWSVNEIDEAIEGMCYCSLKRIFDWYHTVVYFSMLNEMENVFYGWGVEIAGALAEAGLRRGVRVRVLGTQIGDCRHG